jgi:hypothetical protein
MNETEDRVVNILTSQPPSLRPLRDPIVAVATELGWERGRAMAYVERLMLCRSIVLIVEAMSVAADGKPTKPRSHWERC